MITFTLCVMFYCWVDVSMQGSYLELAFTFFFSGQTFFYLLAFHVLSMVWCLTACASKIPWT
jgi:uncharacterized membrane protein